MKHIGFFEGIGGFSLAAEWCGFETVAWCEINKFCQEILRLRFPRAKGYGDIKNYNFTEYANTIGILTGGWPCPKYSKAGKQGGGEPLKDELIRVTKEIRPKWFIFENVPGLISPKLSIEHAELIEDMEAFGYETTTFSISANHVGAKQMRERIWIVGRYKMGIDTDASRGQLGRLFDAIKAEGPQHSTKLFRKPFGLHWHEAISRIHRVFNGISRRLDGQRNKALGNAIVPQVAYEILKTIKQYENATQI